MDLKELKALLRLMEGNDVEELEVEEGADACASAAGRAT